MDQIFTERDARISIPESKEHPFFAGIKWDTLNEQSPPFIPEIDDPYDTAYFPNAKPVDAIELEDSRLDDGYEDEAPKAQTSREQRVHRHH